MNCLHYLFPRPDLTATPRVAVAKDGSDVDMENPANIDAYLLFGFETSEPDFRFDMKRGINEGFPATYKPVELKSLLRTETEEVRIDFSYVIEP